MAKDKITEYDSTAANNTVVGDVNLAENSSLPSDMNNAVREIMSHQKEAFGSGTPLYVDQTNNRVGVGTASPAVNLDIVEDSSSTDAILGITAGTGGRAQIRSEAQSDGTSSVLSFHTMSSSNTSEVGRWLAGGGLTFNGDTAAANALDDYEEGEFDVDVSTSNLTVNTSQDRCRYTKIGRVVRVSGTIKFSSVTSSSDTVTITGLPFSSAANVSGGEAYGHFSILLNNIDGGNAGNVALVSFSSTSATIYKQPESGSFDSLRTSDFNSSGNEIYFSGWYTAA